GEGIIVGLPVDGFFFAGHGIPVIVNEDIFYAEAAAVFFQRGAIEAYEGAAGIDIAYPAGRARPAIEAGKQVGEIGYFCYQGADDIGEVEVVASFGAGECLGGQVEAQEIEGGLREGTIIAIAIACLINALYLYPDGIRILDAIPAAARGLCIAGHV